MHYILSSIYIAPPLVHFPNLYNRKHMNSKWPAIHRQASMAKATKLFLSSVILLLYTSLHIQGLYYHLNSMHVLYIHHGKLHHQDVPDCPLLLIYYFTYGIYMLCTCDKQVRVQQSTVMSRNTSCCPGKRSTNCYTANNCCIQLICNGPHQQPGTCLQTTLACNCNNCPTTSSDYNMFQL
jgi:hypothetical protein